MFPGSGEHKNRGDLSMPETSTRSGPERIPVGPFLHYLMAECGVSPHTLAAYRSDLMRFVRWQKSEAPGPLASLDASALSGYVEALSLSGLAPSSVCRHLASLSTFFRFLVFEGRLPENVVKLLIAPAVWDRLPTVLAPTAVQSLLESPTSETRLGRRDSCRTGSGARRHQCSAAGLFAAAAKTLRQTRRAFDTR